MKKILHINKTQIISDGIPIMLKGVNLGGWLLMEGYILHSRNVAEQYFKKDFSRKLGKNALLRFEKAFRDNFIRESDFKTISALGFNCLRVPFHYKLVEQAPFKYSNQGLHYLDNVISWAEKYGLWVILDLHAAPGCQNHDWHSDSTGRAELWTNKRYQDRTCALWEYLAARYKNKKRVAGYNLVNEPVLRNTKILNAFYKKLIRAIRGVDQDHILFLDGNNWSTDIECLDEFDDDNICLSIHTYEPLDFTFNLVPQLRYPLKSKEGVFNKEVIKRLLRNYAKIARKRGRPILVGEFGVNAREGHYDEHKWLADSLKVFGELGFHWTYWTYKAIKNAIFPDGIFSFRGNPPWVHRHGPKVGWETFADQWPQNKKAMTASWQTKNFETNKEIVKTLKKAF